MRKNVNYTDEEIEKALEMYPDSFWNQFTKEGLALYRNIDRMIVVINKLL